MKNALWHDIQAQASNLGQVIAHLYGPEKPNLQAACSFLDHEKPIIFIGMTSAAYLCHPAEHFLSNHGRLAMVMQASDALHSQLPALHLANVVINSRSGETVEIVKLAQTLKAEKIPFWAVTNEPDSQLAHIADGSLWTNSLKDDLVSTNIITAMMTAMLIFAAEASGQYAEIQEILTHLPNWVAQAVTAAWEQTDTLLSLFRDVSPIYLLHRGGSKGAANCGRLVLEEVARRPGIAMEAGEFRQGPIEVVDESFGAVIFAPTGITGQLNHRLARDIAEKGGRVYLVGQPLDTSTSFRRYFQIPPEAGIFQPVLETIPLQILAYRLAASQGFEPGQVQFISKIITTETGIPNEVTSI